MGDTDRNLEYMGACMFEVTGWQRPIISNLRGGCGKGSIFDNHPQNDHVYVGYNTEKFALPVLHLTVLVRVTVLVL